MYFLIPYESLGQSKDISLRKYSTCFPEQALQVKVFTMTLQSLSDSPGSAAGHAVRGAHCLRATTEITVSAGHGL